MGKYPLQRSPARAELQELREALRCRQVAADAVNHPIGGELDDVLQLDRVSHYVSEYGAHLLT